MKREVIEDLIVSHYTNDPVRFFNRTLEVLKEFKKDGCDVLVQHIQNVILPHLKVAPKREEDNYERLLTREEWEELKNSPFNLVPQEEHF